MPRQKSIKPKVRLKDIADEAGLSVSAVSMALSDHANISPQTIHRVKQLTRQLGYKKTSSVQPRHVGAGQVRKHTRIGFMIIGSRLQDESHAAILHELTLLAHAVDIRLELAAIESKDSTSAADPVCRFAKNLDTLLLSGYVDQPLLDRLRLQKTPCVILGNTLIQRNDGLSAPYCHTVTSDYLEMGRMATARLFACGHRRIAFICETLPNGLSNSRWLSGYRLAHLDHDLPLDPSLVQVAGRSFAGGGPAAVALMELADPPTGYVIPDARISASFLTEMQLKNNPVNRHAVISSGSSDMATTHGVEDLPRIFCDPKRLAKTAFSLLTTELRAEIPTGINLVEPSWDHLPEPHEDSMPQ